MGVREAIAALDYCDNCGQHKSSHDAQGCVAPFDIRTFTTGASRNAEDGKLDYDGFLSPTVLRRYAEYMHRNRRLADGSLRDSDNWQRGMPEEVYRKSLWRHFVDVWTLHRSGANDDALEDALCAVLFNASGLLHEVLRRRNDVA